jgi:hypothetical protein
MLSRSVVEGAGSWELGAGDWEEGVALGNNAATTFIYASGDEVWEGICSPGFSYEPFFLEGNSLLR